MQNSLPSLVIALLLASGIAVPACAGDDTLIGTGVGAAVGGLFGSQFGHGSGQVLATGLGVAVGGLIGNDIGQSMEYENSHVTYATGYGSSYASEPAPTLVYQPYSPNYVAPPAPPPIYVDQQAGTYCRQYSQRINIGGRIRESYGVACLQPDGSWRVAQ